MRRRRRSGLEWAVRIVGAVVLLAAALLAGELIRGHNPTTIAAASHSTTTSPTTTAMPLVLTKGCAALLPWIPLLERDPTQVSPTEEKALVANPTFQWQAVVAMRSAPRPAYGTIAVDATTFIQATSLAETNGNLVLLKKAALALTRDCHVLGLRNST